MCSHYIPPLLHLSLRNAISTFPQPLSPPPSSWSVATLTIWWHPRLVYRWLWNSMYYSSRTREGSSSRTAIALENPPRLPCLIYLAFESKTRTVRPARSSIVILAIYVYVYIFCLDLPHDDPALLLHHQTQITFNLCVMIQMLRFLADKLDKLGPTLISLLVNFRFF